MVASGQATRRASSWNIIDHETIGDEARRVYAILAETDDERDRRWLVELVGRKGGTVMARELQQSSRLYRTADDA
jgi:hypothetical protein